MGRNRQSPAAGQVEAWAAAQSLYVRFKTGCESGGARGTKGVRAPFMSLAQKRALTPFFQAGFLRQEWYYNGTMIQCHQKSES